ncbi:hypothetical protein PLIIFM63780_009371 [Purpureocillium lilacinum]|nr:hypothetical protein PLIIFM63780_009371 [Purpureocillium lilacinum]
MLSNTIVLGAFATIAAAHIKISNPVPFQKSGLDNSPLKEDWTDFPCKVSGSYGYSLEGASNVYPQGSKQQLEFVGTAVHGGGSCQVSITTDLKPSKSSVWKVIKSIEGGCPAQGQVGNMGDSAGAAVPYKYDYNIPKELAAGNYTLAWTWFNKVGNREMYMNCAPLTVTGSGGSDSFMNTLPNMFVANLGPADHRCGTKSGTDLKFPDPGQNVVQLNGATNAFNPPEPTGGAPCPQPVPGGPAATPVAPTQGNGGSSPTTPASVSQPGNVGNYPVKPTTTPAASQPGNVGGSPQSSGPGGVFITVPTGGNQPTAVPTQAPSAPVASQPPTPSNSQPGNGNSPAGAHAQGAACTTEGAWNCIGGTSFQRCASGTWSAAQPMAAGVQCTAGESNTLETKAKMSKRAMRWARRFAA